MTTPRSPASSGFRVSPRVLGVIAIGVIVGALSLFGVFSGSSYKGTFAGTFPKSQVLGQPEKHELVLDEHG